jgi:hypothetical protein
MHVSGVFVPADGQAAQSVETVTVSIYADERGGAPLWEETQQVAVDANGRYSILLGASRPDGLPLDLFASGEARWMERRFERRGEHTQPRVLMASVPYALKASDADTLGGRPASAYVVAGQEPKTGTAVAAQDGSVGGPLTAGTIGRIGKFVTAVDLGDSAMFESAGRVGIGTTAPADTMHVSFSDSGGTLTGYAVQNTGSSAFSYSGMLFYDQNGALAQFQGFNNATHEYRINNVASSASINFMTGSTSRLRVTSTGVAEVSNTNSAGQLTVGPIVGGSDFAGNFGVAGDGPNGQGVVTIDRLLDDGLLVRFRRNGLTQGTIDVAAGTVTYNAFTGSHYARTDETIERGLLVSLTGKNGRLEDRPESEIIYGVSTTRRANDPSVLGAYLARQNSKSDLGDTMNPHLVEAVGNGEMWVIDTGRALAAGDYLVSSDVEGHAMTDPGTFDASYIVGRVAEPINWKDITTTVTGPDGRAHKRALVSVFFENFVIDRTTTQELNRIVAQQDSEIQALNARLAALEQMLRDQTDKQPRQKQQ